MNFRTNFFFAVILATSTFACAAAPGDEDATDDQSENEAALSARAKRLAGSYSGQGSVRPPTFQMLRLHAEGSFEATVDTGIRCITTPCPSAVYLYGTYSAGSKYLTLKASDGAEASDFYGRYLYDVSADGGLVLRRNNRGWDGWSNDLVRAAGILPDDATKIVAESPGGGFVPPPPAGSTCGLGQQKYSLTISTRKLTWSTCEYNEGAPLQPKTGSRTISTRDLNKVLDAVRAASVHTQNDVCGADKPWLKVSITSPEGTKTYNDSFYACRNDGNVYIDGIDAIFGAMREASE